MKFTDRWWSAPTEGDNGGTVIVTGRDDMDEAIACGKYIYRIDVYWNYEAEPDGMPCDSDALLMEQATDALQKAFKKNTAAIMTGIYTGDERRDWIFYCLNLRIFSYVFNSALESLPQIPLVVEAHDDPEWEEYNNMRDMTYIPDDEN